MDFREGDRVVIAAYLAFPSKTATVLRADENEVEVLVDEDDTEHKHFATLYPETFHLLSLLN